MKILHIENYFDPQAGYQINELLYASKEFDDDVYLITSKDMSRFHKEYDPVLDREFEEKTGVKIIRLDSCFKLSSRIILKGLDKCINNIKPDILFMHGIGDFRDLFLWKKKKNYKIVRDCHMSWVASQNRFRKIFYMFFKYFFSTVINNTDKYEKVYALGIEEYEYLKKIGVNDNKIEYMLHGYNDEIMYFDESERKSVRKKYNFKDDDIVISYIGKFNYLKRPDLIFEIIQRIDPKYIISKNIKLLFIGPKDNNYTDLFDEKLNKIDKKVQVVVDSAKAFKDLRKYYSCSDICIFPKQTSLSSIHAQVCRCPVVMEDHESNKERVINNNNLYPIDDFDSAAEIIRRIIDNREYIKEKNFYKVIEKREYKNQVKQIREIISSKL